MTKEQFIDKLHKHVDRFSTYIDECNAKYPEATTENLDEVDWFESFIMWSENLEDEE